MNVKAFQIHKKASVYFKNIQDKYSVNFETTTTVLADGTTQSFKSNLFADFLTKNISNQESLDLDNLIKSITISIQQFNELNFELSSNSAIAILEKAKIATGSTSTFLAVQLTENELNLISIGDCNVFFIKDEKIKSSFPFNNKIELDLNNSFINTKSFNGFDSLQVYNSKIQLEPNYLMFVCSDAISRFLFDFPDQISSVIDLDNHQDFLAFCELNWQNGRLEQDDISLIIIADGENKLLEFLPDADFKFEETTSIPEITIVPNPPIETKKPKLTPMEYNDLNNKIKTLENEVKFVSNKLKNIERLFIILFVTLLMALILPYLLNTGKQFLNSKEEKHSPTKIYKDSQPTVDSSKKKNAVKSNNGKKKKIKSTELEKKSIKNDE